MSSSPIILRVGGAGSERPAVECPDAVDLAKGSLVDKVRKAYEQIAEHSAFDYPTLWKSYIQVFYCERIDDCSSEWEYYTYGNKSSPASGKMLDWCNAVGADYDYLKSKIDATLETVSGKAVCIWCEPYFSPNTVVHNNATPIPVFELEFENARHPTAPALALVVSREYDTADVTAETPDVKGGSYGIKSTPKQAYGGNIWVKWWERPHKYGAPDGVRTAINDDSNFTLNGHPWQTNVSESRVAPVNTSYFQNGLLALSDTGDDGWAMYICAKFGGADSIMGEDGTTAVHEGVRNISPESASVVDGALAYDVNNVAYDGQHHFARRPGIFKVSSEDHALDGNVVVVGSYWSQAPDIPDYYAGDERYRITKNAWHRTDAIKSTQAPASAIENDSAVAPGISASAAYPYIYRDATGYLYHLADAKRVAKRYSSFYEDVITFSYDVEVSISTGSSGDVRLPIEQWMEAKDLTLKCGAKNVNIPYTAWGLETFESGGTRYFKAGQTATLKFSRADAASDGEVSAVVYLGGWLSVNLYDEGGRSVLPDTYEGQQQGDISIHYMGTPVSEFTDVNVEWQGYTADREVTPYE